MTVSYNPSEMEQLWRRLRWLEPERTDASVTLTESTDLSAVARREMRLWYLWLMMEGSTNLLTLTDLAGECTVTTVGSKLVKIILPEVSIKRLVSLHIDGFPGGVSITDDPTGQAWLRQSNRFWRAHHPMALWHPSEGTLTMHILPANHGTITNSGTSGGNITAPTNRMQPRQLTAVVDPGSGLYTFQEEALATIPSFSISTDASLLL